MVNKYKKIMITGSNGMLGLDLCKCLSEKNELSGLDIKKQNNGYLNNFYEADITDKDLVEKIVNDEDPDIVIHAAAWADVDGCEIDKDKAEKMNKQATENIASAVKDKKAFLVSISTDFVFDGMKNDQYVETDKVNPINFYGKTKLEAENVITSMLEEFCIIRTSWLFGNNGKNFVRTIMSKALSGEDLRVVDDQVGSPTYTKDLAEAIDGLLCVDIYGKGDIYHVSNSGQCSWFEFAEKILEYGNIKEVGLGKIRSAELKRPAKRPQFSVLNNEKFEKLTAHRMRSWQEALKEYIENEDI